MTADGEASRNTPAAHVRGYGELVDTSVELVRVLPGGRALHIAVGGDAQFVLKWDRDEASKARRRAAIDAARRLGREAGWPVPAFDLVEDDSWLYVRQRLMPGTAPARLTSSLVEQVGGMVEATAGLGTGMSDSSDWPVRLLDTLVAEPIEPTTYCDHGPLQNFSAAGRKLIRRIEELGGAISATGLGGAPDLMHWDLHPGNLLVQHGQISAVIDLDNAGPGRRGFDLVTFALSCRALPAEAGARSELFSLARAGVDETLWLASVAHLTLRFANWALRSDLAAVAEDWIEQGHRWLGG